MTSKLEVPPQWQDSDEPSRVYLWRFGAALNAGLEAADAHLFAEGEGDTHQLAKAAAAGATGSQLARIFL